MRRVTPSRSASPARALHVLLVFGLLGPAPSHAQPVSEDKQAMETIAAANRRLNLGRKTSGCSLPSINAEIVVCGRRKPDPRYEPVAPPPSPDIKTVALGAPPMSKGVGAGVSVRGCFLQKCPKELYFIDLKAIPKPPPGSDADRIAKGEVRAR